jgi:hypothetical protein
VHCSPFITYLWDLWFSQRRFWGFKSVVLTPCRCVSGSQRFEHGCYGPSKRRKPRTKRHSLLPLTNRFLILQLVYTYIILNWIFNCSIICYHTVQWHRVTSRKTWTSSSTVVRTSFFHESWILCFVSSRNKVQMRTPHGSLSYIWRVSDNLVWSSCGMLASRGEWNKRGEMSDPMSLYPPLIPHDVKYKWF